MVINYCCLRNRELVIVKRVLSILKISKGKPLKTGIKIGYMRLTSYSRDCLISPTRKVYSQRNHVL